ncbi:L-fucose mutarotase [Fodinisporobacter ferrooxydans]|uniref:L-fucose mutarotase n=1 Tax=Fodinisporobacter ferrooxydans TaxID=2901836 RepID=A0ABY4CTK0_9BACL|nr:L-fucose mutarotase [Alicyclobacillaceae bacterium MYW30-H2]
MLKGIPAIISPELIKTLMEMGHGDEIVLADANFPAASHAGKLIRCDGHGIPALLAAIMRFFPLDTYADYAVSLMQVVPGDPVKPAIWDMYLEIIRQEAEQKAEFCWVDRFSFYEQAKQAYAIVATGERALYGNIILKKGVIQS